jgi:hypothetical protein
LGSDNQFRRQTETADLERVDALSEYTVGNASTRVYQSNAYCTRCRNGCCTSKCACRQRTGYTSIPYSEKNREREDKKRTRVTIKCGRYNGVVQGSRNAVWSGQDFVARLGANRSHASVTNTKRTPSPLKTHQSCYKSRAIVEENAAREKVWFSFLSYTRTSPKS